jgi:phosphate transport system protein
LRQAFRRAIEEIDQKVMQLFALVSESVAVATDMLLAAERASTRDVAQREQLIDSLYADIEQLVERHLLIQAPVASEFRYLLSVLRIVPELERSGDLAEHIAARAAAGLGAELTPAVRGFVDRMGSQASAMWRAAADAWADRDGDAAERLDELDDDLDELHEQLMTTLAAGEVSVAVAMEMALVGRFYERLGDHALHIAERVRYIASPSDS